MKRRLVKKRNNSNYYNFVKKIKEYHLYLVFFSLFLFLILLFFIDIKTDAVILFTFILILEYTIYKDRLGQEIVIAFLFALFIISYYVYDYTENNLKIGRINLFPLVAWTAGLVLIREVYERTNGNKYFAFAKICLTYWICLFALEFLGYWLLGIRLNSNFSSLFGLGVIHAPFGIKLFYVLAGPMYILITNYLKVK